MGSRRLRLRGGLTTRLTTCPRAPGRVRGAWLSGVLMFAGLASAQTSSLPTVWVVGDSTANKANHRAWADPFAAYFDAAKINVQNRAGALSSFLRPPSGRLLRGRCAAESPTTRTSVRATHPSCSKMAVIRQRLRQTFPAHGLHRNAICQTIAFVGALSV
jgi:hypothetical protein